MIAITRILILVLLVITKSCVSATQFEVSSSSLTSTTRPTRHPQPPRGGGGRKVTTIQSDDNNNNVDGASIPNMVFNLVKSLVGAGVLGLPAGIAAGFGNTRTAVVPAVFLICAVGTLSSYGFCLIGRVCAYTGATSYRMAWSKSVGESTAWLPALCTLLVTSCTVLACSMILSNTSQALLETMGLVVGQTPALLGITVFVLLPLCLLKQLSSLAPFSLLGIIGMVYTCIAMCIRYVGGDYQEGGKYFETIPTHLQPKFGSSTTDSVANLWTPNAFLFVSILSAAFMAHYNAPKFYLELQNNTVPRYMTVVGTSFFLSILLFVAIATLGYLTFGQAVSAFCLNNYSTQDNLMSWSRIAVTISLIFSHPLAFCGVRDGLLDLCNVPAAKRTNRNLNTLTVVLLSIITSLALVLKNLSVLLAFGGSTWGCAVVYLFPTYMLIQCVNKKNDELQLPPNLEREVPIAKAAGLMGLCMGCIGVTRAIKLAKQG